MSDNQKRKVSTAFAKTPMKPVKEFPYINPREIPIGTIAYFSDRMWFLKKRGGDLYDHDGYHYVIQALDREHPQKKYIHEKWIYRWLSRREMLHFHLF